MSKPKPFGYVFDAFRQLGLEPPTSESIAQRYRIEVRITFWEAKWRATGCLFDAPPKPKRMKGKRAIRIITDDPYSE